MSEHSLSMRAKCTVLPRALCMYTMSLWNVVYNYADGSAESAFLVLSQHS